MVLDKKSSKTLDSVGRGVVKTAVEVEIVIVLIYLFNVQIYTEAALLKSTLSAALKNTHQVGESVLQDYKLY